MALRRHLTAGHDPHYTEEEASSVSVEGEDAWRQRLEDLTEDLAAAKAELQILRMQVPKLIQENEDLKFEAMEAREEVDDLVDMVQDEVAQCDIPVCPDPKYKAYRASYALRGLETLGKEFRSLHNKHFGLARHILKFLKQSAIGNPNTALRQFRNVVRVVYPNLPEYEIILGQSRPHRLSAAAHESSLSGCQAGLGRKCCSDVHHALQPDSFGCEVASKRRRLEV